MADKDMSDIFTDHEDDEDDTTAFMRKALEDQGFNAEEEDDGAGMNQEPIDGEDGPKTVSQDEGNDLAAKAKIKGDVGDEDKPADDKTDSDDEDPKQAEGKAKDKDPLDLSSASADDLLKDIPDDRRAEIARRLTESHEAFTAFEKPYIKDQMTRFGAKPADVVSKLTDLASFAQEKPDEYIAWVAQEMASAPDKIGDVLAAAAKFHGYKVVKDEPEDDLFEDEDTKALRAENASLKAQLTGGRPSFGPDSAQRAQVRDVENEFTTFLTEKDESGQPKRPYFKNLEPQITAMAQNHVTTTGQGVTTADLDRFYTQSVADMQAAFGNPAAQSEPRMAPTQQNKAAASVQRAKAASKSIDGAGQGASRRPVLNDDAPIEDVLRHFWTE